MVRLRRSEERGVSRSEWLDSRHSFSFADYLDPDHMEFHALRVINEDRIAPARGFGAHPHRDMEILTYPISGVLEHQDSLGHRAQLGAGHIQLMTAGTGIVHSEVNPDPDSMVHLLQIWIRPAQAGDRPGYQEKRVGRSDAALEMLVSPDGRDDTLRIDQDVFVHRLRLDPGSTFAHPIESGRAAWLQMIRGEAQLGGLEIGPGDGAAIEDEPVLELTARAEVEALLFDLP